MLWLHELRVGSPLHYATIGWCLAAMAAFALWGRALESPRKERRLRRAWVVVMGALSAVVLSIAFHPRNFDARYSLPLHLCDVAILVAGVALWTRNRLARTLTYFWTLGLSTQAFLTPVVAAGPAHLEYWFFWILHVQVVGAAVYDLVVHGY
ncbi:MAG: TIGR02206 family membrane protein, partial [Thermoanaerobaculia bacterium]|nr:TIGR02206 family membrane protein [Thermoanaerobaculia bacterium]